MVAPAPPTGATPETRSEILKLEFNMLILDSESLISSSSSISGERASLSSDLKSKKLNINIFNKKLSRQFERRSQ